MDDFELEAFVSPSKPDKSSESTDDFDSEDERENINLNSLAELKRQQEIANGRECREESDDEDIVLAELCRK
jgi:hypothetical protein